MAAAEKERERSEGGMAVSAVSSVQCSGGRFGMINNVTAAQQQQYSAEKKRKRREDREGEERERERERERPFLLLPRLS